MTYDAIIIGGGAAGLFCAITAGRRGRKVVVLEHNAEVGRKVVISGGGRCNFTNREVRPENFVSGNPHFCKSALAGFGPDDFLDLVKKHKIAFYEKTLGQLFCRDSSRQIVEMLLAECEKAGVEIRTACSVSAVRRVGDDFVVKAGADELLSRDLVVACGGLSFSKIGATGLGYDIARQFGLAIVETRASLVAMKLAKKAYPSLAGISLDAEISSGKTSFRENILFTHRGLSGPAILQISNYWRSGQPVTIDLAPETDIVETVTADRHASRKTANFLSEFLPQRFVSGFLPADIIDKRLDQLSNRDIESLGDRLNRWQAVFSDTEGYDRAEVTLGGVSTAELSSKTMESKKVRGLYFIGEVVDVTGWLGGYNFQWAWASAFAAGNAI